MSARVGGLGRLDRFPGVRHGVHASAERALRAAARAGLDLNRRRVRAAWLPPSAERIRFRELAPAELLSARPPAAAFDLEPAGFSDMCARLTRGYSRPAFGLMELQGGRFHLPSGLVSAGGLLPSELIPLLYFPHSFNVIPALRVLYGAATPIADGVLINLPMSNSYYHWMCEILPRALAAAAEVPDPAPLYIAAGLPEFVFESLAAVGLGKRCVRLGPGVYRASRLTVPTFERAEWPSPRDLWRIRDRLRSAYAAGSPPPSRRLLISRRDAVERRVVNEEALLRGLRDLGFQLVVLGGLAVGEQVRLFAEAEVVVGTHGAGLTNILFAPQSCRVVELTVERHLGPSYVIISSTLGQPYGYVSCEPRGRHLAADAAAVRAVLAALEQREPADAVVPAARSGPLGAASGPDEQRPEGGDQQHAGHHQLAGQERDSDPGQSAPRE